VTNVTHRWRFDVAALIGAAGDLDLGSDVADNFLSRVQAFFGASRRVELNDWLPVRYLWPYLQWNRTNDAAISSSSRAPMATWGAQSHGLPDRRAAPPAAAWVETAAVTTSTTSDDELATKTN